MPLRRKEKPVGHWDGQKIKQLRHQFDESQSQFCQRLGVSVDALQHWEQNRAGPSGPVEILLDILQEDINSGKLRPVPVFSIHEQKKARDGRRRKELAKS